MGKIVLFCWRVPTSRFIPCATSRWILSAISASWRRACCLRTPSARRGTASPWKRSSDRSRAAGKPFLVRNDPFWHQKPFKKHFTGTGLVENVNLDAALKLTVSLIIFFDNYRSLLLHWTFSDFFFQITLQYQFLVLEIKLRWAKIVMDIY